MKFLRYMIFIVCGIGVLINCTNPTEKKQNPKQSGDVLVSISTNNDAAGKTVYLSIYTAVQNPYEPNIVAFIVDTLQLDENGMAVDTVLFDENPDEKFRIRGLVDMDGTPSKYPEPGDLLFDILTPEVDGDITINVDQSDFQEYETISGAGFSEENIGNHHVRIWESEPEKMSSTLGWIGDVDQVHFKFDGTTGAIGRVGKKYSIFRVDDIDSSLVNVEAQIDYNGDGTYYFGIYGWTFDKLTWSTSTIRHEFYVVEHMTRDRETDPFLETITVDGIEYDMHRHPFGDGSYRYKAIRKSDFRISGPINLKPFFEFWRQHGMNNLYLNELTWHIELLGHTRHKGSVTFWNIDIPDYTN